MCFCSENVDFLYLGGACMVARGGACVVARGHVWLLGGVHGCWGVTCMVARGGACVVAGGHSCWGACMVARGHAWLPGGMCGCWGACMVARGACMVAGGWVPCDLSHHAFDVTCMLSPHQLRASSYAPAYILVGHVTHMPPSLWTDRHL